MQTKALLFVGCRAVFVARIKPAMAVEKTIAGTRRSTKTFVKYAARNGLKPLIRALKNNEECGVIYHYEGQLTGDYDLFQSEEEIIQFINCGL